MVIKIDQCKRDIEEYLSNYFLQKGSYNKIGRAHV